MRNRKITAIVLCALLVLSALSGCGSSRVTLTEEETNILEMMGDDVHAVADADYAEVVTELQDNADEFTGEVYQLEGIYTTTTINGEESPYVYRTLVNGDEKTECGLPLKYLEKDLPDGAWIRVSGIVNSGEFQDLSCTVLEVVAVESLDETGQTELTWNGSGH
jgi:uncharacterized membrane protein YcgQ (UPF0703/DUF1980 family)